jgi:hypothetical protein
MICSSLCRVVFTAVLLSWVWENSHSRRYSFRGLGDNGSSLNVPPAIGMTPLSSILLRLASGSR